MNIKNKKTKQIIIIAIIITIIIIIYNLKNNSEAELLIGTEENKILENEINNFNENQQRKNEVEKNSIIIYITGAIKKEGVYELEENSRIADAIEIAGGVKENADLNKINLAYKLEDGMKINIPTKEMSNQIESKTQEIITKQETEDKSDKIIKNEKININKATQTELESLPGIGTSTAQKIINYRKEKGKFNKIEDIMNVDGIGESKYKKIKGQICV